MCVKFNPGKIVATPGAMRFCDDHGIAILDLLARHVTGDWGDMDEEDKRQNDAAITNGTRIFSAYQFPTEKIWIITEADRSSTTVLLPSEY